MRLKTIGVLVTTVLAAFTLLYWFTDTPRREAIAVEQDEELLHFGEVVFSDSEEPAAAGCARCHGAEGGGGEIPNDPNGRSAPSLRSATLADKLRANPNYVRLAIRYGGVVVSGNVNSPMPAWSTEVGGPLNEQQIDALVALIETWLEDAEAPTDVEDTPEAGEQVFGSAGCAGCHGADLGGGAGPPLTNVGNEVGNLPNPVSQQEQYVADYEEDPYLGLGKWIRDSAGNYNDGEPTGMPPHPESALSDSALRALITFLLTQTEGG